MFRQICFFFPESSLKVKNKEKRMEKEVCDLKVEVSTLKQMFAKLYTLFQNNKNKPDVKRNENKSENDEVQETEDGNKKI